MTSLLRVENLTDAIVDTHEMHPRLTIRDLRRRRVHFLPQRRELAAELRLRVFRQRVCGTRATTTTAATATSGGRRSLTVQLRVDVREILVLQRAAIRIDLRRIVVHLRPEAMLQVVEHVAERIDV